MKYIGLDFDGVIVDSVNECLLVGQNSFLEYIDAPNNIDSLNEIPYNELIKLKYSRKFIRSGEDYVFICMALNKNHDIKDQNSFDRFKQKHGNLQPKFYELFYKERLSMFKKKRQLWIKLNPFYPGVINFCKSSLSMSNFFIISTKEKRYIIELLKDKQIEINHNYVFQATNLKNKQSIINDLLKLHQIKPNEFIFVDDHIDTLKSVKYTGVQCFLANWGYNSFHQERVAIQNKIPVLSLSEFCKTNLSINTN